MKEKEFYHVALNGSLLNGKKLKKRIDAAIERIPAKRPAASAQSNERRSALHRWVAIPAAAALLLLTLGVGTFVVARNTKTDRQASMPTDQPATESPSTAERPLILKEECRIYTVPAGAESTPPKAQEGGKLTDALKNALNDPDCGETMDLCIWFTDEGAEEAVDGQMRARYPELYDAYRNAESAPDLLDQAIGVRRDLYAAYYMQKNDAILSRLIGNGRVLFVSQYAPMCAVTVPVSSVAEIAADGDVSCVDLFENRRSEPSGTDAEWYGLKTSVTDLSATAASVRWTTELRLPKGGEDGNPFEERAHLLRGAARCFFNVEGGMNTPDAGALIDFVSPGEITYAEENGEWVARVPYICALPEVYPDWPAALPTSGEVTIRCGVTFFRTEPYGPDAMASDGSYADMTLFFVQQTFTFDADRLLHVADPVHVAVPLSGAYVLSVHTGTGFRNERVNLDGVTLDAEIHYTEQGVYAILSIADPGALTEAQQASLLAAIGGGPFGGDQTARACALHTDNAYRVSNMTRVFWGATNLCRLEIDVRPEEYAKAEGIELTICATYATGEAGGDPRDDWSWDSDEGNLPELTTANKELAKIEIPLPNR